jgi:hypothetical protein
VNGNSGEPGRELRSVRKLAQMLEGPDVRILDYVFGF